MTEAHSTLEAVARGIRPDLYDGSVPAFYDDMWANDLRAKTEKQALAAIKALAEREPSEGMVDEAAGHALYEECNDDGCEFVSLSRERIVATFRAMLSQLVKEAEASAGKEMGDE